MHTLGDIITLSQCQASSHWRSRARSPLRIQRIDIKGQMDRRIGPDMGQRHLHDTPDTMPVNVVHAKCLDTVLAQDPFLTAVDVPQADINQFRGANELVLLQPSENLCSVSLCEACQKCGGHAVNISRVRGLGCVDVGVGVDPDDGYFAPAVPFADRLCGAGDGADGYGVIAAQGQDEAAFARVLVDLGGDALSHGGHRERVLHVAVWRVGRGRDITVVVDSVVMVDGVPEIVGELG